VLHSAPGTAAFPVRLADEVLCRALALLAGDLAGARLTLYDPCCGSGALLCTLGYLHWPHLGALVGSDVDPDALALAARNLSLLDPDGLRQRTRQLAEMQARYGKQSHADALASAARLAARLASCRKSHVLATRLFLADATDGASLRSSLPAGSVDLVVTDVPYGWRATWRTGDDGPPGRDALWRLLAALRPALAPGAVVAVASDKAQRAAHEGYRRRSRFQLGRRHVVFLTPEGAG
jgi:tRNA G10  N-methylase Trm11